MNTQHATRNTQQGGCERIINSLISRPLAAFSVLLAGFCLLLSIAMPLPVSAQGSTKDIVCGRLDSTKAECTGADEGSVNTVSTNVVNILSFAAGAISVIVLVVAGFMFVLSGGNPENTKRARDAIMYAVIGILITFAGRAIVLFVLDNL